MARPTMVDTHATGRSVVGWGAVFSGALIGVGVMALLTSLWFAISSGVGVNWVGSHLNWFVGGTAILSLFLAGLFAAWFNESRSIGAGLVHGITEWGLVSTAMLLLVPGVIGVAVASTTVGAGLDGGFLWTTFWSLLIGLGTSLAGGLVGAPLPVPGTARTTGTPVQETSPPRQAA